jgi:membrane-bound serine protease (ClpP class)
MAYDPPMSSVARWFWAFAACAAALAGSTAAWAQSPTAEPMRAVPAGRQAGRVAVLPITGPIDQVTLWSLERRMKAMQEGAYDALVIELDTPGGEVDATLDICLRLKSDAPANTVAWIHPKAYSAGTIIALACREIVVAPGSVFGDAAPISVMPGLGLQPLPAAERAKFESPILDELDAAAAKRGEDQRLLQAFVVTERELWLVERTSDGARRFADRADLELLGLEPQQNIVPPKDLAARRPATPGELPLTAADRGGWRVLETIDSSSRLLVAQSDEAMRWGLAADVVKDDAALQSFFAANSIVRFPESWAETLVRFLISWPIRIILIGVFVVALVIESLHPGVGIAGGVAAAALLLLVGAPALIGLAEWWEILLVLAGIVLIGVEVFVLPGTGFAGITGAICVLVGLVASFTGTDPTSAAERGTLLTASSTTIAGIFVGAILAWFASRWFRETAIFRRAVLATSVNAATEPPPRGAQTLPPNGTLCIADTDLRPSGRCDLQGELFDAQSTGEYIQRGAAVRVVGRMGTSLVVERADDSQVAKP